VEIEQSRLLCILTDCKYLNYMKFVKPTSQNLVVAASRYFARIGKKFFIQAHGTNLLYELSVYCVGAYYILLSSLYHLDVTILKLIKLLISKKIKSEQPS